MGFVAQTGQSSTVNNVPALRGAKKLTSTGESVPVAAGWQTITDGSNSMTCTFDSNGNSVVKISLTGLFTVLVGGSVRVIINGGSFSNTVITVEPSTLGIGTHKIVQNGWVEIEDAGTYTVTAQAQGVGILASITPAAATQYSVEGWPS